MSNRTGSHQLSNGLVVSGSPEHPLKDRQPAPGPRAVPYTGGYVKNSDELGTTYGAELPPSVGPPSRPPSSSLHNSGSARSGSNSGFKTTTSGPMSKKSSSSSFSGPTTPIQPTGLISGPTDSARSSGQQDTPSSPGSFSKATYGSAVTTLGEEAELGFRVWRVAMWVFLVAVMTGLLVGAFLLAAVKKAVILLVAVGVLVPAMAILTWNYAYRNRWLVRFSEMYPVGELRDAIDGQFIKVTGVVTCGSIPLETSFQRIPRCVYTSSDLYECRGNQMFCSWGCRYSEKHVADFYISDSKSGLRALVKAGYGAKVSPFVKPTLVSNDSKNSSPNFTRWLSDRGLTNDDRVMQLKESYIKEGSTVSIMGVVQRHENVLMIVQPTEPISMGCNWARFLLPTYLNGLILMCNERHEEDVIPV